MSACEHSDCWFLYETCLGRFPLPEPGVKHKAWRCARCGEKIFRWTDEWVPERVLSGQPPTRSTP